MKSSIDSDSWFLRHIVSMGLVAAAATVLLRYWLRLYVITKEWILFGIAITPQVITTWLHLIILIAIFLFYSLLVRREINKRKKAEELLHKSVRETELFAYSVIHDLKNPAIAVHGFTQRLIKHHQNQLDARGREHLRMVLEGSSKVLVLLDQIQIYIKTKEMPLKLELVDSKELVKMIREEFFQRLSTNMIKWRESKDLPRIKADRVAISRVLRNLIDNALKYGGENLTEIKILYQETDKFHTFIVIDNGIGISQESTEIIFNPFQRSETCDEDGSGLGLAIVKEVAKQHGGNAWADSDPQQETRFHFSIAKDL